MGQDLAWELLVGRPHCSALREIGRYSQLGLEDHNQDGEDDSHSYTIRQAQKEGREKAHHPDEL